MVTRKYKLRSKSLGRLRRRRTASSRRAVSRTNRNNNANRRTRHRTMTKGGRFKWNIFSRATVAPAPESPRRMSPSPTPSSASGRSTPPRRMSPSPTPSSASERSTPSPSPPRASGIDAVNANFEETNREITEIVPEINKQLAALEPAISKMNPETLKLYQENIVFIKEHFKAKIETMQQDITERRDAIHRRHEEQFAKFEEENSKLMADFRDERDPKQRARLKTQSENKIAEMNKFSGKIDADAREFKRLNHSAVSALKRDMHTIIHQLERNIKRPQPDPLFNIHL